MNCLSVVLAAGIVSGSTESVPEFPYLFSWLAWPAPLRLTDMACTSAVDVHWSWGQGKAYFFFLIEDLGEGQEICSYWKMSL